LRQLRSLNCDEMHGFLFSELLPLEMFEASFLVPSTTMAQSRSGRDVGDSERNY
jgi:hypothetical protein